MAEAKQYVAQEDFMFRGVHRKKGDVFRIVDHKAEMLGDKVKLHDENSAPQMAGNDVAPDQNG